MLRILVRKTVYGILVIWGVVSIIFFLFNILPGDPASLMAGQRTDQLTLEQIRSELGLDQPAALQYLHYLNDLSPLGYYNTVEVRSFFYYDEDHYGKSVFKLSTGNNHALVAKRPFLGRSFLSGRSVGAMISEALPNSLILAFTSILIAFILGNFLGVVTALRKDSLFDRMSIFMSTLGMALPSFFAAIVIAWLFAFRLGDFTGLNLTGNLFEADPLGRGMKLELKNIILPAITLGIRPLAVIVQLSRNSLIDVLQQDFIRTARAKGLSRTRIILIHAWRNSLAPVVTAVSGWFAGMLAGVVFVEYIFGWKGLGYMIVNALNYYDLPVVTGCVLTIAIIFVAVNILVDISYSLLDPRVRNKG